MPKLKTHKGTAKRVKITKTGKVTLLRAFGALLIAKISKIRKRRINSTAIVTGGTAKNIKRALGV